MDSNHRRLELNAYENHPSKLPCELYDTCQENPQHETHKTTIVLRPRKLIMHSEEIYDGLSPTHYQQRYTEYYQDEEMVKITAENPYKAWKTIREQQAYFIKQTADDGKTAEHSEIYQDPFNIKDTTLRPGQISVRHQMPEIIKETVNDNGVITVKTHTGSTYQVDTGDFIVNARNNVLTNSTDTNINARNNINVYAQNNIRLLADNCASIEAKDIVLSAADSQMITAGSAITATAALINLN
jgi:quercetin dioxygenase-like cupin family protein